MNKFRRVISCGSLCFSLLFAVGCNNTTDENNSTDSNESTVEDINNGIIGIYESYRKNAENKGENPLDYETWLASIKGEKGDPGVDGKNGKSAYETYCEYHPEYTKSEEEWINEFCKEYSGEAGEYTYDSSCNNFAFKEAVIDGIRGYVVTFYFGYYTENAVDIVIPSYYNSLPVIGVLPEYADDLDGWCPDKIIKSIKFPKTIKLVYFDGIWDDGNPDVYFEGDVKYILDLINDPDHPSNISRLYFNGTVEEFLKTNLSKYFSKTDIYFKKGNEYICELPQKSKLEFISNSFRNTIQSLKDGIESSLNQNRKFTLPNSIDITYNGETISYIPSYEIDCDFYESASFTVTPFSFDFSSEEYNEFFDYGHWGIQIRAVIKYNESISIYSNLYISIIPKWHYDEYSHWHEDIYYGDIHREDEENHTFNDFVTPPTNESCGYTTHKCSVCGYQYIDEDVNPQDLYFRLLEDGTYEVIAQGSQLSEIIIPKYYHGAPVTRIGQWAFSRCTSLTSITIPDSVTSMGDDLFWMCTSLTSINVDPLNNYFSSEDGVLYNKEKTILIKYPSGKTQSEFSIPNSVKTFPFSAFEYASIVSLNIPSSVVSIDEKAFSGCTSLTSINVDPLNNYFSSEDGVLYNKEKTILIKYPSGKTQSEFSIPNSVKTLAFAAFQSTSIVSLNIPSSVVSIDEKAFFECTSLTSITIPASVTSMGDDIFLGCTSLTSINVDPLNSYFSSEEGILCNKEKTVLICYPSGKTNSEFTISNNITSIGYHAFGCDFLTSITIPSSVNRIDNAALGGALLRTINFDGTIEQWNNISKDNWMGWYSGSGDPRLIIINCKDGVIRPFDFIYTY